MVRSLSRVVALIIAVLTGVTVAEAQGIYEPYYFGNVAGYPCDTSQNECLGGADGLGVNARFWQPTAVALDNSGNLYVANLSEDAIRKITPDRVVTLLAGCPDAVCHGQGGYADGTGSDARFDRPWGIAVDAEGNVLVSDQNNVTIRKITPAGVVTTLAGCAPTICGVAAVGGNDGIGSEARFGAAYGIGTDSAGNLYVCDTGAIRKVTPQGVVTTLAGLWGSAGYADGLGIFARFWGPTAVAVDENGNVFVADSGNHAIRMVTPGGWVSTVAGCALCGEGGYVDGSVSDARFHDPYGVGVDHDGNIYVAEFSNYCVRKIGNGVVRTLAGLLGHQSSEDDGIGSAAHFSELWSNIAVKPDGTLYLGDYSEIRAGVSAQTRGPAPVLNSVDSNPVVGSDDPVTFTLSGANFLQGATIQSSFRGGILTEANTIFVDSGTLTIQLTPTTQADASWSLRVKNPDLQISGEIILVVATPTPTATPAPTETPTPTPSSVNITGNVTYCSNPSLDPVPNVILTLSGDQSGSTTSDSSGHYQLSSLAAGGTYTVTPSHATVPPGSAGITTVDVIATQRHFLGSGLLPLGCRRTAGDVNGDSSITTIDVIAVQRFFLGLSTGIANVGKYRFSPASRLYSGITGNQTNENYDALVFGDIASPFIH